MTEFDNLEERVARLEGQAPALRMSGPPVDPPPPSTVPLFNQDESNVARDVGYDSEMRREPAFHDALYLLPVALAVVATVLAIVAIVLAAIAA